MQEPPLPHCLRRDHIAQLGFLILVICGEIEGAILRLIVFLTQLGKPLMLIHCLIEF